MVVGGPVYRALALICHTFSSALIVYSVRVGQWRWFWISFVYLSAIDGFFDAFGHSSPPIWSAVYWAATVIALVGLRALERRYPRPAAPSTPLAS